MTNNQTKDLFQLQTELVDMKVDMAASRTIDRVVEQISNLKHDISALRTEMREGMHELRHEMHEEIHGLRHEMRDRFSSLETRVTAVETKLGISAETQNQLRSKLMDYGFRAIWAVLTVGFACFVLQLQALVR